MVQEHHLASAM